MNRRDFLLKTAVATSLLSMPFDGWAAGKKLKKFGCQLYSVRDKMPADPKGTMEALAKMGYKQFESYGKDPFWGMNVAESKAFLKNIGVEMISAHTGLKDITDELAEKAKAVGLNYLICPFIGMQPDMDAWKRKADEFNEKGELCRKHGLKFAYHNHSYSFAFVSGMKGQLVLLENTDPSLVCYELDMCWSEAAGENTIAHLEKYGNRYELCHVKQLAEKGDKPKQTDLADGIIDYNRLLSAAKKNGMKHFLVEQEQYPADSMKSMQHNADFMRKIRV